MGSRSSQTTRCTNRSSQRHGNLRGRDRPANRRDADHPLCLGRRCRAPHQSADRARPNPRRDRAGCRPGDVRAGLPRPGFRPTADRLADGLRHAARRHATAVRSKLPKCFRRRTRLASRPAARAAPPPRPLRSSAGSSTLCAAPACATSRCRPRPIQSGRRFKMRKMSALAQPGKGDKFSDARAHSRP